MSEKLYYSIGEVAETLGVKTSAIRFWETQFPQVVPNKTSHGTRQYSADQLDILRQIYHLTRDCGFTLSGVRDQLRADKSGLDEKMQLVQTLNETKAFLQALKDVL